MQSGDLPSPADHSGPSSSFLSPSRPSSPARSTLLHNNPTLRPVSSISISLCRFSFRILLRSSSPTAPPLIRIIPRLQSPSPAKSSPTDSPPLLRRTATGRLFQPNHGCTRNLIFCFFYFFILLS
ncbi:hypothetical protein HHK36_021945 [Tetracentron sinense]|uniref:Uncharacterized protein n=1 Tax=Tetracentron sinense TaxID=13715 RepID=A0A834YW64_TETSI|nr:hypothetical protein HHK36_021945 [Tetracentron sinense]